MSITKKRSTYTCFISSPVDCERERKACREVIDEFNGSFGARHDFTIKALSVEDMAHGVDKYPQAKINSQFVDKTQLYVGIMHTRFGTPTLMAGSGTEEEYDIMLKKKDEKGDVELLFYFNENVEEKVSEINVEQLSKLQEFKKKVGSRSFYCNFNTIKDLKIYFESDLSKIFSTLYENEETSEECDKVPNLAEEKETSYRYRKLWQQLSIKLRNEDNLRNDVNKLYKEKEKNMFPKYVYNQSVVINSILRKKNLCNDTAEILALAINEVGLLPSYYSNLVKDYKDFDKINSWKLLKTKEATFRGESIMINSKDNESIYENIQRLLFHLNFNEAKSMVCTWKVSSYWILHKAMRMACMEDKLNEACQILESFIDKEKNSTLNFYGRQFSNLINNVWPQKHDTSEFHKYSIDGLVDMLDFMTAQLRGKTPKPKGRGWIGMSYDFNGGDANYEKSLRILRYISDTGIFVNFGIKSFYSIDSWYLVFKNLYEKFPYPCFFYSIQYNDKEVQKRIGQDYAFSPILVDFNKDILIKAIKAIGDKETPNMFINGLLNVIGQLYVSIDENVWCDYFLDTIFSKLLGLLDKGKTTKDYSALISNIGNAISCIKRPERIEWILCNLLSHYKDHQDLIESLIYSSFNLSLLNGEVTDNFVQILNPLIENFPDTNIVGILYIFMSENLLGDDLVMKFINKVKEIGQERLPKDLASSFYLCILAQGDYDAQRIAKENFLSKNMWYCGVLEDGNGWTAPDYVRMHVFNGKIKWSKKELGIITSNLIENMNKFYETHRKIFGYPVMKNNYLRYLLDIIQFIDCVSPNNNKLSKIKLQAKELIGDISMHKTLIEQMMSNQSMDVYYTLGVVLQNIKTNGFNNYLDEINFIIDRAIICKDQTINIILEIICFLVREYPICIEEENMIPRLNIILVIYYNGNWRDVQDFRPDKSFYYLYTIAKYLNSKEYKNKNEEAIKYWMSDEFVRRFT